MYVSTCTRTHTCSRPYTHLHNASFSEFSLSGA